ncbi:MAG: ABC transporter permease [bacterium]
MISHLAWRNVWRVPRRTLIILLAVTLGIWNMILMASIMRGSMEQMVHNSINTLTGHIQIHKKGYFENPVLENTIMEPGEIIRKVEGLPPTIRWTGRMRAQGIISNARNFANITVVGITPESEASVSFLQPSIIQGRYLRSDDHYGLLIGQRLAEEFGTGPGKKLVLMTQDSQNNAISTGFRIVGIFKAEMETTEKSLAFITLPSSQKILKLDGGLSEICLVAPHRGMVQSLYTSLSSQLDDRYEVMTWKKLLPLTTAYVTLWEEVTYLWFIVVFMAMAFGLINTMLMAVFERVQEFGMLKAVGMKPRQIIMLILAESIYVLTLGVILGDVLIWLTIAWLSRTGINLQSFAQGLEQWGLSRIIFPVIGTRDFLLSNSIILILGLAVSLYPALKASYITPKEAMTYR